MTCKSCGREVPLEDINCFDCNEEGPFTRASRLAPWVRHFAWLPVAISSYPFGRVWLRSYEAKDYGAFGIGQRETRRIVRDSDATAIAALCEDIAVPKDLQARANGIAK